MTLILQRYCGEKPSRPAAINPLHVVSMQTNPNGTSVELSTGRTITVSESLEVALMQWSVAMNDMQDLASWNPDELPDVDDDSDSDLDDAVAGCLS